MSAREATRRLLVLQQQVAALDILIGRVAAAAGEAGGAGGGPDTGPDVHQGTDKDQRAPAQEKERDTLVRRQVLAAAGSAALVQGAPAGAGAGAAAALGPAPIPGLKNTIVKTVVQRLAATNAAPGTSAAAAGVKRPAAVGGAVSSSPGQAGAGKTSASAYGQRRT